ncbi:MAG: hypothetical protein PF447_13015 [Spirochaetaceae bacterium]|nr:hypothetical protein [Spirochaetaceae bacterium]
MVFQKYYFSIGKLTPWLHILSSITDNALKDDLLEDELRQILAKRRGLKQDHFDRLIQQSFLVELKGPPRV